MLKRLIGKYFLKDRLTTYNYYGVELALPMSHDLPYNSRYPYYNKPLAYIVRRLYREHGEKLKVIDVGANIGDTAALVKFYADVQILCIEGNELFANLLYRNTFAMNGISVCECYIGERENGVTETRKRGTIALTETAEPEGILTRTFDWVIGSNPEFADAKLLKIDTDGFDPQIIRSAENFIRKAKPVIFFEYDTGIMAQRGEYAHELFETLTRCGYSKYMVFSNRGEYICTAEGMDDISKAAAGCAYTDIIAEAI